MCWDHSEGEGSRCAREKALVVLGTEKQTTVLTVLLLLAIP